MVILRGWKSDDTLQIIIIITDALTVLETISTTGNWEIMTNNSVMREKYSERYWKERFERKRTFIEQSVKQWTDIPTTHHSSLKNAKAKLQIVTSIILRYGDILTTHLLTSFYIA